MSTHEIDRDEELAGYIPRPGFREERNTAALRVPPQSVEAEQHVLGALMIRPEALHKLADWLAPEDFYRRDHQLIYRAICNLTERKIPADAIVVGEWFESQGLAEQVPNGYLIDLASNTHSAANVVAYAEIVADKAKLRKLVEVGTGIVNDGFQPEGRDTTQLVASAQQAITQLAGNPRIGGVKTMRDIGARWYDELLRRYENRGALIGLPTPWAEFNRRTSGLQPGNLIVLAARPSMGKSAWAVNVATANSTHGKRVLFFNLEMTDVSIYNRAIASLESVPLAWLRSPDDEHDHFAQVTAAVAQLKTASLLIDDTPGLRIEQIIARARREHMRAPLDMLIVDHLHLIPLPGKTRETVEIGAITSSLKALAKELSIPVILLAQLNRSVESRPNKRPVMSDLRESGNIEQDADLIVFLYRDDYYAARDERQSEHPGAVEMIIAKQREGEAGKVWGRDALAFGRIDDHDGPPPQSPARNESPRSRRWAGIANDRRSQE